MYGRKRLSQLPTKCLSKKEFEFSPRNMRFKTFYPEVINKASLSLSSINGSVILKNTAHASCLIYFWWWSATLLLTLLLIFATHIPISVLAFLEFPDATIDENSFTFCMRDFRLFMNIMQ